MKEIFGIPAFGLEAFEPSGAQAPTNGSSPTPRPASSAPSPNGSARQTATPHAVAGTGAPVQAQKPAPAHHPDSRPGSAGRGYNLLVFEGRLAEAPVLRNARTSDRVFCRVPVVQDQPDWNGQPGTQSVDRVMFDERARMFVERFRKGDAGTFIGRTEIRKWRDQQGQFHMDVSLHLERVSGHKPVLRERDIARWLAAHHYDLPAALAAVAVRGEDNQPTQ